MNENHSEHSHRHHGDNNCQHGHDMETTAAQQQCLPANTRARCILKSSPTSPAIAQSAAWRSSQWRPPCRRRSTPARCIPRSSRTIPATARFAAWRLSRRPSAPRTAREHAEMRAMSRRFWIGARVHRAGVFIAMGHLIPGLHIGAGFRQSVSQWIEFVLATPVVLWAGGMFFSRAGAHSSTAASTCSRSSRRAWARLIFTAQSP